MGKRTKDGSEEERVRLVSPGFWEDDLAQMVALTQQRGRNQLPYMHRQALYLGTKVLSASMGPHRQTRRRGLYKDMELASELQPILALPVQFCERHGCSVITLPASVAALTKALGGKELDKGVVPPDQFLEAFRLREGTIPTAKGEEAKGNYWIEDLEQLEALTVQHGRDHQAFLRKVAFRIGVLLLTASGPYAGPFGLYSTPEQLAGVLGPLLAPAVLFLENQGYTVLPIPTIVTTLLDLIGTLLEGASHVQSQGQKRQSRLSPGITEAKNSEEQEDVPGSLSAIKGRVTLSKERRNRLNLTDDGSF